MNQQNIGQRRNTTNNHRLYQFVLEHISQIILPFTVRYNAKYDTGDMHEILSMAATHNTNAGGIANANRATDGLGPTPEWLRDIFSKLDSNTVENFLYEGIKYQLAELKKRKLILKNGIRIAIDFHNILRYDKKPTDNLRRGKSKKSTIFFESYITVQCLHKKCSIVLAVLPVPALSTASDFVPKIMQKVKDLDIPIDLVMADREFFTTEIISYFNSQDIKFLMPCKNTPRVIEELRDYAKTMEKPIRKMEIESTSNVSHYTMMITERKTRKKKSGDKAEDKFIGFATNKPGINPKIYSERWIIENGYKMIESMRIRTRSNNPYARAFCFMYSVLMYNLWTMARIILNTDYTQSFFKKILEKILDVIDEIIEKQQLSEPPPTVKNR